jgi:hypothetical protein
MSNEAEKFYTIDCPMQHGDYQHRHRLFLDCVGCNAHTLANQTLECVEFWFEGGTISEDARDGYRHVWAISAPRSDQYRGWLSYPDTEGARAYAKAILALLPSGRGYC